MITLREFINSHDDSGYFTQYNVVWKQEVIDNDAEVTMDTDGLFAAFPYLLDYEVITHKIKRFDCNNGRFFVTISIHAYKSDNK